MADEISWNARWAVWGNLIAGCCWLACFVLAAVGKHPVLAVLDGLAALCFLTLFIFALRARKSSMASPD